MTPANYKKWMLVLLVLAAVMRLVLCWVNPPMNAFDNHLEPILMIMKSGELPEKRACWQCYQPPVFYSVSALIGLAATKLGLAFGYVPKLLQLLSCLFSVLSLWFVYLILNRLTLSGFAKLVAFGIVCFLPRHIYMSAMHSNDSLTVLLVALCVYLLMRALDKKFSYPTLAGLSLAIVAAVFTKYTGFVVLPMAVAAIIFAGLYVKEIAPSRVAVAALLLFVVPMLSLGGYMFHNHQKYGDVLPWNDVILNTATIQVGAEGGPTFADFKPWTAIDAPVLSPGNIGSFWTLIHGRMWFDMEPKFILLTDRDLRWWGQYFGWLRGHNPFPEVVALSGFTRLTGAALILLGLVPLALSFAGIAHLAGKLFGATGINASRDSAPAALLLTLFLVNVAGIVMLTLKAPVFSSMKAIYLLNSLPAFAAFVGFGVTWFERVKAVRYLVVAVSIALLTLIFVHYYAVVTAFVAYA